MDEMQDHDFHQHTKTNIAHVKRALRFTEEDVGLQKEKSRNHGYFLFLLLTGVLLIAAVYCKLTEENCVWEFSVMLSCAQNAVLSLLKAHLVWHTLKALCIGVMVLFFTWGVMYFDSTTPGIEPPSPLSPQRIRTVSGHTFHSGYILAVVNGLLCTVFFLLWS